MQYYLEFCCNRKKAITIWGALVFGFSMQKILKYSPDFLKENRQDLHGFCLWRNASRELSPARQGDITFWGTLLFRFLVQIKKKHYYSGCITIWIFLAKNLKTLSGYY